ncbi:MAG TPA: hypothetical protein VEA38_22805 [Terriglobales bacterium]|nr:hypothetical protein [Terriglobales bacterium]
MRALVLVLALLATAALAESAEWQTVRPGISGQNDVRTQFGAPTRMASQKVEGYDSPQWVYEGAQAPSGTVRVTIDFGVLTPQGYRVELVRMMTVEPRSGVFTRKTVTEGWGEPDVADVEGDKKVLRYRSGLFVYFDKDGWIAERMYFTPPQPTKP